MKSKYFIVVLLVFSALSFAVGLAVEYETGSRFQRVFDSLVQDSAVGTVTVQKEFDEIGQPFFDLAFSTITIDNGSSDVVIYKAKPIDMAASVPSVTSVNVSENRLYWEDGMFIYELRLVPTALEFDGRASGKRSR